MSPARESSAPEETTAIQREKLIDYTQHGGKRISTTRTEENGSTPTTAMLLDGLLDESASSGFSDQVTPPLLEISCRSIDTFDFVHDEGLGIENDDHEQQVEPINFFLKIPPRQSRKLTSDLRERFRRNPSSTLKQSSFIQAVLTRRGSSPHRLKKTQMSS